MAFKIDKHIGKSKFYPIDKDKFTVFDDDYINSLGPDEPVLKDGLYFYIDEDSGEVDIFLKLGGISYDVKPFL